MTSLREQWDAILADEPDDWSHLAVELRLDDDERMEEAGLLICSVNPWHGQTWRSGSFRFRVARTHGYGAAHGLARSVLGRLDDAGIAGAVRLTASLDAVRPVATQGPA